MSDPRWVNKGDPLGKFTEEMGETVAALGNAIAAAGKTLRFGADNTNPYVEKGTRYYGETNEQWLLREWKNVEREFADAKEAHEIFLKAVAERNRIKSHSVLTDN